MLPLTFDPSVTCNFVVTDKQKELLNEDDWSKRREKGTSPYATGEVVVSPDGLVYPLWSQLTQWGIYQPRFWAYDYLNDDTGKETKILGYYYRETGEAFTWDRSKDHGPAVSTKWYQRTEETSRQ